MYAVRRGPTGKSQLASERASIADSQQNECRVDLNAVPNEADRASSHGHDADQVAARIPTAGDGTPLMLHSRFSSQQAGQGEEQQHEPHEHDQPEDPAPHKLVPNTEEKHGMSFLAASANLQQAGLQ